MGKHVQKSKSSKEDEMDEYDNEIDELYRPYLIHSTTYALLTEQILSLMPSDRNVLLTMNEYDLSEINPMHPNTSEAPTHIIIFCIRFIAGDLFQPIGGLLTYKYKDQSVVLAECLKAYINDLWKLGLHVVGTVSPPFESFKGMLSHLVDVENFNTYAGCLVYSVTPIKEIVHIYDIKFLLIKLQNLLKEGDIKFVEANREHRASWKDISLVLNLSKFKILSNYLLDNKDVFRREHIFTQQIFEHLFELEAQGIVSKNAEGSTVLLSCMRSFLQFTELDLVDLKLMCKAKGWNSLTNILPTMVFQKSKKRTCTKTNPTTIHVVTNPSTRRKIDFQEEEGSKSINGLVENIDGLLLFDELEENLNNDCETLRNYNIDNKFISTKKCNKAFGKNKQKKNKTKESKKDLDCKMKLHSKQTYEKQKYKKMASKKVNTSVVNEKTDTETTKNVENNDMEKKSLEKTENINRKHSNQEQINNKMNLNCVDKNNNTDERFQSAKVYENKNKKLKIKCNERTKAQMKELKHKHELQEENFDIVINDAQQFFQNLFIGSTNTPDPQNTEEILSNNLQTTAEGSSQNLTRVEGFSSDLISNGASYNDFCSQTDEETENSVTKICDKVPTIVKSLIKEDSLDEFEHNDVTYELQCTVFGMKRLMENIIHRRVKIAKPDAFMVNHIDYFVTVIKRDKNKIKPVYCYGHNNYAFLNSELAFSTLRNDIGLFVVKP